MFRLSAFLLHRLLFTKVKSKAINEEIDADIMKLFPKKERKTKSLISENKIKDKNIFLVVCNGGNLRNTWKNYEKASERNKIVSKLYLVYPIKNGFEDSITKTKNWVKVSMKEIE